METRTLKIGNVNPYTAPKTFWQGVIKLPKFRAALLNQPLRLWRRDSLTNGKTNQIGRARIAQFVDQAGTMRLDGLDTDDQRTKSWKP